MGKIFGLSLFCIVFVVGILLGMTRRPLTVSLAIKTFLFFIAVYMIMGLYLSTGTEFLRPE